MSRRGRIYRNNNNFIARPLRKFVNPELAHPFSKKFGRKVWKNYESGDLHVEVGQHNEPQFGFYPDRGPRFYFRDNLPHVSERRNSVENMRFFVNNNEADPFQEYNSNNMDPFPHQQQYPEFQNSFFPDNNQDLDYFAEPPQHFHNFSDEFSMNSQMNTGFDNSQNRPLRRNFARNDRYVNRSRQNSYNSEFHYSQQNDYQNPYQPRSRTPSPPRITFSEIPEDFQMTDGLVDDEEPELPSECKYVAQSNPEFEEIEEDAHLPKHVVPATSLEIVECFLGTIAEESNCQLRILPGIQAWRIISLKGSDENIEIAKELIDDVVMNDQDDRLNSLSIFVQVPETSKGAVIGLNSENLRSISLSTGCIIEVPICTVSNPPLKLIGDTNDVKEAKSIIEGIIRNTIDGGKEEYEVHLLIPRFYVGNVVGFKRKLLKQIERDSGAKCSLRRDMNPEARNRLIEVWGSDKQIEFVLERVQEILDKDAPKDDDAGVFDIDLRLDQVEKLTANKGEAMRLISKQSDAKIIIVEEDHGATVTVSGGLTEAEFARHLVAVHIGNLPEDAAFIPYGYNNRSKVKKEIKRKPKKQTFTVIVPKNSPKYSESFEIATPSAPSMSLACSSPSFIKTEPP
uniref:K Homology domain-containing protein n=1 Tax=Caenorhabditis japonica TaxID=281687 RepID=A0A8R1DX86_CAEJA